MDAFEEIVAGLFRQSGFWVHQGYKINLSKDEKVEIGKPSLPRPEIDMLAYSPCGNSHAKPHPTLLVEANTLLWVECKSFLDSSGVAFKHFVESSDQGPSRFKIFTSDKYRKVVSKRLLQQVGEDGLTMPSPILRYCLVAGHTHPKTRDQLHSYFQEKGWLLYDETLIRKQLVSLARHPYENDVAMIVAKLFEKTREK